MTPIGEILHPGHINLALSAKDKAAAVAEVFSKLNGDPRVGDFAVLTAAVQQRAAAAISQNGCGIYIAHGRTESVSSIVMAAGRSTEGFLCPDVPEPVKLVFVVGIPSAFNADYLRIVGAIARICRDEHQLDRLLAAKTAEEFIHLLSLGEVKL